jgi:hypothetical protein
MKKEVNFSMDDVEEASNVERSSSDDGGGGESTHRSTRMPQSGKAGRLSTREINFAVPSNEGAQEHVRDTHGHESWRLKCLQFIHHAWFQRMMMCLLLLDVLVLFTELFLLALYPQCNLVERDCIACCPENSSGSERWLVGGGDKESEEICEPGYSTDLGEPSCDPHKWERVHKAELGFYGITISILSLFLLENLVELAALGPRVFFKQFWFVADLFIVSISLLLELVFHFAREAAKETLGGFLVFFRLWRFLRISHGLVEVTTEVTHEQYDELIEYTKLLETKLEKLNEPLPETTERVRRLCHPKDESP